MTRVPWIQVESDLEHQPSQLVECKRRIWRKLLILYMKVCENKSTSFFSRILKSNCSRKHEAPLFNPFVQCLSTTSRKKVTFRIDQTAFSEVSQLILLVCSFISCLNVTQISIFSNTLQILLKKKKKNQFNFKLRQCTYHDFQAIVLLKANPPYLLEMKFTAA